MSRSEMVMTSASQLTPHIRLCGAHAPSNEEHLLDAGARLSW